MNRAELEELAQKELDKQQSYRCRILCCASTPCISSGGTAVSDIFKQIIREKKLRTEINLCSTGCMGPCSRGPMVTIQAPDQNDVVYERVTPKLATEIMEKHIIPMEEASVMSDNVMPNDSPFFTKQQKVVLSNSGLIDPERLEDYVAHGGYHALAYALREMTPEEVCNEITNSGLRGPWRRRLP